MKVSIHYDLWKAIRAHAAKSFPNECVGLYIFSKDPDRPDEIHVLEVYKCRNVSVEKSIRSEMSKSDFKRVVKICKRDNAELRSAKLKIRFFVGQYHSHPTTKNSIQSSYDRAAGRKKKEYRHQLILGVKSKNENSIRKTFYHYNRKTKAWNGEKLSILKG